MSPHPGIRNLITDYYDRFPRVIAKCANDSAAVPGFALPELDDATRRFFSVATAGLRALGAYRGHRLLLLDLTHNPQTNTAETFASLLMVARAVEHLRRWGEPVLIFSPTSANLGIALRDSVARAHEAGLATPEQLRVVMLAPAWCRAKMRAGRLDPSLNPVLLYGGDAPENVKTVTGQFVENFSGRLGIRLWYPREPAHHLIAHAARAFLEAEAAPTPGAAPRVHAQAVSSALGLLGYNVGREVLEADRLADPSDRPGFLLVQHLATPDMVLSLRTGDFDRDAMPAYAFDPISGLYKQDGDPHFPYECADPCEILDPTFYARRPATSPAMNDLIIKYGGDGIVVSRQECVARYDRLREWIPAAPARASSLREWSLAMAVTGTVNAVDRGLIRPGVDIVIHGTGLYAAGEFTPLPDESVIQVGSVSDIAAVLH
ncbi:MAG TPA: DUF6002 family protein [Candidatus Limnocylindrales bacterium]|nr:DUF6002 family protein [Candidatus Limnocylindrales bacterium]